MSAVAISWTGLKDVGMAIRGSIEAVFEAAGIETLDVATGAFQFSLMKHWLEVSEEC